MSKLPVLMTASVSTRGMKGAAFTDEERERMYVETLKWYLENLPAEQKIVFAENSGWDLGRIKSKVEGEVEGGRIDRRAMAERKVCEWLEGVDAASFEKALVELVEEKSAAGEYRFKRPEEQALAMDGARRFFCEFSRKLVPLSDGRYVYFAPDARARLRNANNAISWAEYAFHAVSSSGKLLDGKNFRERLYNPTKAADMPLLEEIVRNEQCMYRLIDACPENDAVIFIGRDADAGRLEVVTRLDQFGNAEANLGEVTVIAKHKRKECPPPKYRPLTEVVETVAKHQAAGFSPSTTETSIAFPTVVGKGAGRVEFISVDPGICDQSRGKGYNEILLMNDAIKRSKFVKEAGAFMKVTGRYPIYNLPRFLREAEEFFAKGGVFYGDMKDHKVFDVLCKGHTDKWNGHAAYTVLFATTLDFYNAHLADSYQECNDYINQWIEVVWHRKLIPFRNQQVEKVGGGGERNSDHHCPPPPHLSTCVRLRLPVEPICGGFQGSAAQSILVSSSNESLRTKLARFVGNCIRTFTPWFWW